MKRGFLVAVGGAAVVVAGLAGCSSEETPESPATTAEATATGTAPPTVEATAEAGAAKVTIDGQDQNVEGTVACTTMGGNVNIAIGNQSTGIGAVLSEGDPPWCIR